jgi:chemotaxis signal transduction protein
MIPMDHAFKQVQGHALDSIHSNALDAVMGNQQLFSEALRAIPTQAGRIQRELNRTVWNGNVNQFSDNQALNPQFSKILLWEISNTGFKTQDVFERSIGNLHQTVVSSILHDSQFQAALAIDIMDRNLYERANDCRWWALTSVFQSMLSASPSTTSSLHKVNETLTHINGLYTVYDNLVVFDRAGRALAVSNPKYGEFCGQVINESWVHQTLSLNNSQSYTVSDFSTTRLYSGLPTYIFAAPIFDPVRTHTIVGGIGIVFDSTPQFCAMLNDSLPRDVMGNVRPGSFGVFTDRDRRIIASTHSSLNPGDLIDIDDKLFQSEKGQGVSDIAQFNGKYYAVGTSMSKGYREYKDADDPYKSDVLAIIFVPLGVVRENERRTTVTIRNRHRTSKAKTSINDKNSVEIATFYVDSHWIGIVSKYVVEAVDVKGVTGMPGAGENTVGYLLFRNNVIPVVGLWGMLGPKGSRRPYHEGQIVILQLAPEVLLGIMVDELGEIPEIQHELIETVSGMFSGENLLVESIVKPDEGSGRSEMIALISPDLLRRRFLGSKYAS